MLILKQVRKDKRMTLEELAEKSGISKRMISTYESNKSDITYMKLKSLADALGVETLALTSEYVKPGVAPLAIPDIKAAGVNLRSAESEKVNESDYMLRQLNELYRKQIVLLEDHIKVLNRDSQLLEEKVFELTNQLAHLTNSRDGARSA